jgi:hypothetical protein
MIQGSSEKVYRQSSIQVFPPECRSSSKKLIPEVDSHVKHDRREYQHSDGIQPQAGKKDSRTETLRIWVDTPSAASSTDKVTLSPQAKPPPRIPPNGKSLRELRCCADLFLTGEGISDLPAANHRVDARSRTFVFSTGALDQDQSDVVAPGVVAAKTAASSCIHPPPMLWYRATVSARRWARAPIRLMAVC